MRCRVTRGCHRARYGRCERNRRRKCKAVDGEGVRVVTADLAEGADEQLDVSDPTAVDALRTRLGRVDILINSAGIVGPSAPLVDVDLAAWQRTFRINVEGTFLMCRAFVPGMVASGWGRVVNLASIAAKDGNPNQSAYSASKAAVVRADEIARQRGRHHRCAGQRDSSGGGGKSYECRHRSGHPRPFAVFDADGTDGEGGRNRRTDLLAVVVGGELLDRRRVRRQRRPRNILNYLLGEIDQNSSSDCHSSRDASWYSSMCEISSRSGCVGSSSSRKGADCAR